MEKKFKNLINFNKTMGIFHSVQAIIMLFLATSVIQNIAELYDRCGQPACWKLYSCHMVKFARDEY